MAAINSSLATETGRDQRSRALALADKTRPDLSQFKAIKVDAKTIIYVERDRDSEKAVQNWLQRHEFHRDQDRKRGSAKHIVQD